MEKKMFYGAAPSTFAKARFLRNNATTHEKKLWRHLQRNKLPCARIKRQHPIGMYIVDFYCHAAKLVVEVDGSSHNSEETKRYDEERTFYLNNNGLRVIRFSNVEIEHDVDSVVTSINRLIRERLNSS